MHHNLPTVNDQVCTLEMRFQYLSLEIGQGTQGIGQLLRLRILQHHQAGFIIGIRQGKSPGRQVIEEFLLRFQVILHGLMVIQMIAGQVRENPPVERQAADAPLIDRMRANLHKSILASGLYHPGHQGMKRKRVRCRMIRRYRLAIYIITYRGKQSHLMPHLPEHLI